MQEEMGHSPPGKRTELSSLCLELAAADQETLFLFRPLSAPLSGPTHKSSMPRPGVLQVLGAGQILRAE
jgi:hypothetical protein